MNIREFRAEMKLDVSPKGLFPFFADATNLNILTPPWLHFRIISDQPIVMREGTLIDYRLRVHGLPLRWRTRINKWEAPHHFVDEQVQGPYRLWIHEHTFVPTAGGTIVRDHVRYAVPFDGLLHRWFVRPDIEKIFQFRAKALRAHFAQRHTEPRIGQTV